MKATIVISHSSCARHSRSWSARTRSLLWKSTSRRRRTLPNQKLPRQVMIELRRVILVDWYLFRVEEIDVAGLTALVGPNGSGKSAIIDAIQTVLTGANMMSIRFNASAQSASRSERSIRDYCLGVVSLDEKGERSEPTRDHAYTYAILGFVDVDSDE